MYFIEADTQTLRAHASALQAAANSAGNQIHQVESLARTANGAGDMSTVRSLQNALAVLAGRLQDVQQHYSKAAAIVGALANRLDELEARAEAKFKHYGSPRSGNPSDQGNLANYELFGNPHQEPNEAAALRRAAGVQLERLAMESPAEPQGQGLADQLRETIAQSGLKVWHSAEHAGAELGAEARGLAEAGYNVGKFVLYDGTTQVAVNPAAWLHAWQRTVDDAENIASHPDRVGAGLVDGLINPKLLHGDPLAWVMYQGTNILAGAGIGKALGAASRLGATADVAVGTSTDGAIAAAAEQYAKAHGLQFRQLKSGGKGGWNAELNRPSPDTAYLVDGKFRYVTDTKGRVVDSSVSLSDVVKSDRNLYQQLISGGTDRLITDQGGHIIATALGGPGEGINITAMSSQLNQVAYKSMETEWINAIKQGKTVDLKVNIIYDESSMRPMKYNVKYTIEGQPPRVRMFINE